MVNSSRKWNAFMSLCLFDRPERLFRPWNLGGNKKYPSCSYFRKIGRLVFTHPMAQDGWFAAPLGNKHSTMRLLIGIKVIGRIASNGIPSLCPKEGSPDVVFFWEIQLSFCHCSASHISIMEVQAGSKIQSALTSERPWHEPHFQSLQIAESDDSLILVVSGIFGSPSSFLHCKIQAKI